MAVKIILVLASLILSIDTIIIMTKNLRRKNQIDNEEKGSSAILTLIIIASFIVLALYCSITAISILELGTYDILTAVLMLLFSIIMCLIIGRWEITDKGINKIITQRDNSRYTQNNIMENVSHEIGTPMNTILGLTEVMMRRDDIPNNIKEDINNISIAGNQMMNVVRNLIDFTNIQADKLEIVNNEYSIRDMITEIMKKTSQMLVNTNVEFLADVDSSLPSTVYGDDVRIIQAVTNLLSNACKYTHVGIITLRVCRNDNMGEFRLHFDIEDTGIGMQKKQLDELFRNNGCLNSIASGTSKGAGLGLVITKSIIECLGGSIEYVSNPGDGTSFSLDFPQTIVNSEPLGEYRSNTENDNKYMFTAPMSKILVVDDNIVNLFVARQLLESYDAEVTTVSSGEECLKMLNDNYYNLIFMDYVMPEMDGLETLNRIKQRKEEFVKSIPVIAMTAQIINGGERAYLDEGFSGYLSKPITITELETILTTFLPEEFICKKQQDNADNDNDGELEDKAWYKRISSVLAGINIKKGIEYCRNDYTSYINFLRVIYTDGISNSTMLRTYLDNEELDSFRVLVHSIKSVTASAGADKLSFIAGENENAAKNHDLVYLKTHINTLLFEYDSFIEKIDLALRRESEMMAYGFKGHRKDLDEDKVQELAKKLVDSLEEFNIDDSERIIEELERTNLSFDKEKAVLNAKDVLMLFKYDDAIDIIKNAFDII